LFIPNSDIANVAPNKLLQSGASTGQFLGWSGSIWGPTTLTRGWDLTGNAATAGSSFLGTTNNTSLRFRTNNAQRVILDSLGRLGVGVNLPLDPIHVSGSGTSTSGRTWVRVTNSSTNSAAGFRLYNGDGRFAAIQYAGSGYSTGEGFSFFTENDYQVSFQTNSSGASGGNSPIIFSPGGYDNEVARFQQGKVGIGVNASPSARLHVKGSGSTSATWAFQVHNNSGNNNALMVRDDGFVGIGTNAPTDRLDITGANGYSQVRLRTAYTPTGTSDTNGNTGDISWDENYWYVKTAAGWKRTALTTW
jgi:hypothetical protein